jgi:hypothetical protein
VKEGQGFDKHSLSGFWRVSMEDEADLSGAAPRRRPKPDVLAINNRKLGPRR